MLDIRRWASKGAGLTRRRLTSIVALEIRFACAAIAAVLAASLVLGTPASAAPLWTAVSAERTADGSGRVTDGLALLAGTAFHGADVYAFALRYDDRTFGDGAGFGGGTRIPLHGDLGVRISTTRTTGDLAGTRFEAGPAWRNASGARAGLAYAHDRRDATGIAHGVVADGELPLVPRWSARARGAWWNGDGWSGAQAGIGLAWSPLRSLEVGAEIGGAQSSVTSERADAPLPGLPVVGRAREPGSGSTTSLVATFQTGVRIAFP